MEPLTWSHREQLLPFYASQPPQNSDIHLTNLLLWSSIRPTWWMVVDETLLIFIASHKASNHYLLFGGPKGPSSLRQILPQLEYTIDGIVRAPTRCLPDLLALRWKMQIDPAQCDYIYAVETWATMEGHFFRRQRQVIHKFLREESWEYHPFSLENQNEALSFVDKAMETEEEKTVAQELLSHLPLLPFRGGVLRQSGEIAALLIGEYLHEETFIAHVGKGRGAGTFLTLLHLFAQDLVNDFSWINLEQDLGNEGIHTFKERLHPHCLQVKWRGFASR